MVTLPQGQIVVENEIAGRAKIVPFVTREEEVRRAERIGPVLSVRPFLRMRVAALVQENLDDESLEKFRAAFDEKVRFFGSELTALKRVSGDLAAALRESIAAGAQVVAMAGSKLMDPLDPVMQALRQAGARIEKHGVPLHPGTLLWVALRPEKLALSTEPPEFGLTGTVRDIGYFGNLSIYKVVLDNGLVLKVSVANTSRLGRNRVERPAAIAATSVGENAAQTVVSFRIFRGRYFADVNWAHASRCVCSPPNDGTEVGPIIAPALLRSVPPTSR